MTPEDIKFLQDVRHRSRDPEMMSKIVDCAIHGLQDSARQANQRAADMEVVASMAMNTRLFKGNEKFLVEKLEHWKGKTSLRWDDQIAKLKEKNT